PDPLVAEPGRKPGRRIVHEHAKVEIEPLVAKRRLTTIERELRAKADTADDRLGAHLAVPQRRLVVVGDLERSDARQEKLARHRSIAAGTCSSGRCSSTRGSSGRRRRRKSR